MNEQDIKTYKILLKDVREEINSLRNSTFQIASALDKADKTFSTIQGKCNYLSEIHKTLELEELKPIKITKIEGNPIRLYLIF